jgi:hypothetical protein
MKLSNVWKARLSTLLGLAIPVLTGIFTDLATGSVNWTAVKGTLVVSLGLFLTDVLKETQKELADNSTDETK